MKQDLVEKLDNSTKDKSKKPFNDKNIYKEYEIQNKILESKQLLIRNLTNDLELLKKENDDLKSVKKRNNELERINSSLTVKISLEIKKVFAPMIKILKFNLKLFRIILRLIYKKFLPKKAKRFLKIKILNNKKILRLMGIPEISSSYDTKLYMPEINVYENVDLQRTITKTIGIHLHLYYEDLLDEFYDYLKNMPYSFDLYVSVQKSANIRKIKNKLKKIVMLNYIEVKKAENCGRDFGPMFVLFAKKLKKYDYIMHIHSKKSLRTGTEQSEWRRHLLKYLLGSPKIIMETFYLMENRNIGLIYPEAHKSIVGWCYNWLDERDLAIQIMNKLGINFEDNFLEFSAGSMFWSNKKAIEPLLDLNLTWEDFGKEKNQTGGTLEYVFERIPGIIVRNQGYNIAIYNPKNKLFLLNKGNKNLDVYLNRTIESTIDSLRNFDIISFDIFDTLITRKIYNPDDVFYLIEKKIDKIIQINDFCSKRKAAEKNVRLKKKFKGDCSIDEIYNEIMLMENISEKETNALKQIEIQTELELCIPRRDVLEIYNTLLNEGKKIILISDMYLTRNIIEKILKNCGYYNYFDILLSSELGIRKDDGTMWEYFYNKYKNIHAIHIGDNEESDLHKLADSGKVCFNYFIKGKKMFYISNYWVNRKYNLYESVLMGCIINKSLFNSPFALNNYENKPVVNTEFDFGYSILGPLVLIYFIWLINDLMESDKNEVLLFTAREGYYLQKIYNHIIQKLNIEKLNNIEQHYLFISRRAITVANIENGNDIYEILNKHYKGTLRELLYYRLGYFNTSVEDRIIELPRDYEIVKDIVTDNYKEIIENAKYEKENYIKYIEKNIENINNKKLNIIDIGFSGTAQYHLSSLIKQKITGKYFAISNIRKPLELGFEINSCYNENLLDKAEINNNPLLKFNLFLEAFFTAPYGQLKYIDKDIMPIYSADNNISKLEQLEKVYKGIIEFIDDVYQILKDDILNIKIDKKILLNNYKIFSRESLSINGNFKKLFDVDDSYCSNGTINAIELYNNELLKQLELFK